MFDNYIAFYCICMSSVSIKLSFIPTIFDQQNFNWLDVPYWIGIGDRLVLKLKIGYRIGRQEPESVQPHLKATKESEVVQWKQLQFYFSPSES